MLETNPKSAAYIFAVEIEYALHLNACVAPKIQRPNGLRSKVGRLARTVSLRT